ncbi:MAG: exodeoxyribonuclease VII large subunit [Muribaculaceae bacterium]|nr:exodeoxyribonuclease VII large subunit [Muribaculaceae bacterium]
MSEIPVQTLQQFTTRLSRIVASDSYVQNVWITAETYDVRTSGGHCYLELVEKDANGRMVAKIRATIWASTYYKIYYDFLDKTGQEFRSDLKVMVCVSATIHPVFGLSANITDINPAYTLGDAMQRRNEMIRRLTQEGIINENRRLPWPAVPQRIAVISAKGAAGYGDFIHQLYSNPSRLRFVTRLFPAALQGDKAPDSIIRALEAIHAELENWDCVVIIRGGGATTDLLCFENYDLASNIAQFPLPVVIGLGHERDVTLLDYVANMRVKTPTAAAEWLIQRGESALSRLQEIASGIALTVSDRLTGCHRQLAYVQGQLPAAVNNALTKAHNRVQNAHIVLSGVSDRRLRPELVRLASMREALARAVEVSLDKEKHKIDAAEQLVNALSPKATLRRGYSITRSAGRALTGIGDAAIGEVIETILADGSILSKIVTLNNQ